MSLPKAQHPTLADQGIRHHEEGLRLAAVGKLAEAVKHFQAAIQFEPDNPVWQFNCGLAWQHLQQLPDAIAAYRKAVRLKPDLFDAWSNLSAALKATGDTPGAIAAGRQAVILCPNASGAHLNLGNALKAAGDWAGAEAAYRRALILEPGNPKVRLNLANSLREAGRLSEAIALCRQAVERSPDFPEAHRDLAFALMLSGDLQAGWIENEWRWRTEEMSKKRRVFEQPAWSGEPLAGRSILIYTEQGFGDAIQFVRYIELVAQRAGRVVLECPSALKGLFETLPGVSQLVVREESLPHFDVQLPLLSLPRVFGTTLKNVPANVPYLKAPAGAAHELPPMSSPRFKVGLVWAGRPEHINDQHRSIALERFGPLSNLDGVAFFSLQVGERAADLNANCGLVSIGDLSPHLRDFAATAAAIDRLDLVISVDTSVAHLAGALGKPVWLLLPFAPDWRWMLGREDSPWYPTMRLFRQQKPGDWPEVMERVRVALQSVSRGRTGRTDRSLPV